MRSKLSLENNLSPASGNARRILKIFLSHAVNVVLDQSTETLLQMDQPYALLKAVLSASRSGYVSFAIVPRVDVGLRCTKKYIPKHSCGGKNNSEGFLLARILGAVRVRKIILW